MNLARSLTAFRHFVREDAGFRRLGRPPGWSVAYQYASRWHERCGRDQPLERIEFRDGARRLAFEMNARYLGAFKGVYLDREYDCQARLRAPVQRVLDLGGNIGFGSVFLSSLFPLAHFAVVEPDPRNLRLLRRNLNANGVASTVIAGAIGPERGQIALRFGSDPTCSSLAGTGMHQLDHAVTVEVLTVPQVLNALGWESIDLLKVDIEGAETELFGRQNAWLARVRAMLVEVHPNTTPDALNAHLKPHGFRLERHGAGREPVYFAARKP